MTTKRLLIIAALGLASAACQAQPATPTAQVPGQQTVTVQQTVTAEQTATATGKVSASAGTTDGVPANFPVPQGVKVVTADNGGQISIVLSGTAPSQIADFYRSSLPTAGYKITKDKSVSVGGASIVGMEFTGHGYNGKIAVTAAGTNAVAITLDRV